MGKETVNGRRRWSDRSGNRVMAHLKTFAKWVHKLKPFPLGNPMDGKGPIATSRRRLVESPAPGIVDRQPVKPLGGVSRAPDHEPMGQGLRRSAGRSDGRLLKGAAGRYLRCHLANTPSANSVQPLLYGRCTRRTTQ